MLYQFTEESVVEDILFKDIYRVSIKTKLFNFCFIMFPDLRESQEIVCGFIIKPGKCNDA
ncbi:MAG: hypothetical protein PUG68_07200 [Lachnospiraceae bacterium]|nr:hypothetical protein [Lachnospiraceae bacterium]MDY2759096.1 hypothetical protein [Lachnospiraceae bacterium]